MVTETTAKSTTKTMVRLKIKRSTPRLVLKTEPALVPPKALPNPAPRTWSRMKLMTATQSIICTIRIAGSHWAKICSSLSCSPICFLGDYIILRKPGRKVVTDERHLEISPVILSAVSRSPECNEGEGSRGRPKCSSSILAGADLSS